MIRLFVSSFIFFSTVCANAAFKDFVGQWKYKYDASQCGPSSLIPRDQAGFCDKTLFIHKYNWLVEWPTESGGSGWQLKPYNYTDGDGRVEKLEVNEVDHDHATLLFEKRNPETGLYVYRSMKITRISKDQILYESTRADSPTNSGSYSIILHRQ